MKKKEDARIVGLVKPMQLADPEQPVPLPEVRAAAKNPILIQVRPWKGFLLGTVMDLDVY